MDVMAIADGRDRTEQKRGIADDVLARMAEDRVRFIELEFTDIFGAPKSIDVPVECAERAIADGVWFDGSSVKGFARIMESDHFLRPDLATYAVVPGLDEGKKTARLICDVHLPDGTPSPDSPRMVLRRAVESAQRLGYTFRVGPEVEFYLFRRTESGAVSPPDADTGSYFDSAAGDVGSDIRKEIMAALRSFGIDSERAHHEVGAGQHEIGFRYGDALATADRVIALKRTITSIAHRHGLIASFMPKPLFGKPGSGMHVHFSLFGEGDKPLFHDAGDPYRLSALAKSFIAGQLRYVKEIQALINPTVNSYKRLVSGYEAPVYICWGSKNRSALVRIPHVVEGKATSVRGELRCPDPSASPYLAFAAMLAVGLRGIEEGLELAPPLEGSAYEAREGEIDVLAGSLDEALAHFRKSRLMRELLGEDLFTKYIAAKEQEARAYRTAVTDWELRRYL